MNGDVGAMRDVCDRFGEARRPVIPGEGGDKNLRCGFGVDKVRRRRVVRDVVVGAPPEGTVVIHKDTAAVHIVSGESVGLVEFQPLPRLGLHGIGDIDAFIPGAP